MEKNINELIAEQICGSIIVDYSMAYSADEEFRIKDFSFSYPERDSAALSDVSLTIKKGEFITLCGPSGCAKTTLLRHLKPSATPYGETSGSIFFEGAPIDELSARDAASKIGFVMQSPDNQIVTDKVWHELAFGLESLGVKTPEIRLRVAEMASFFGIQTWFHRPVSELSGGQKQMLALASIMALQPHALILDEPTGQLDPIAAGEFLSTIGKINRELGVTIIMTEHRLEEVFPLSTRVIAMDKGRVVAEGTPQEVGVKLCNSGSAMSYAMPTPMRVWMAAHANRGKSESGVREFKHNDCPITVGEGSLWLKKTLLSKTKTFAFIKSVTPDSGSSTEAVEAEDIWFKYGKNSKDVLKGVSFKAYYGQLTAILGGNGTGKTTTLSVLAGIKKPFRGKVHSDADIFMLPQNPQSLFVAKTVREDLQEVLKKRKVPKETRLQMLARMVKLCRLDGLLDSHPYDLSGGEQQRAALAKILLLQPKILLLDEPTKGLDAEYKQIFAGILKKLTQAGAAVIMVSHDVEFCAEHADMCSLFFDGNIVTQNDPRSFFSGNSFYTTSANRMARDVLPKAITVIDIVTALGKKMPPPPSAIDEGVKYEYVDIPPPPKPPKMTKKRRFTLFGFIAWLVASMILTLMYSESLGAFIGGGREAIAIVNSDGAWLYVGIMLALAIGVCGIAYTISYKRAEKILPAARVKQKLTKRTIVAAGLIFITIPLTIYMGITLLNDRQFYFIATLIILQTMVPFALVFESRKPQARELVILAVLVAIAVAGRTAFFMLPQFKPVVAIVIITGVAFGGEAGFMVGTMTMFVSNMYFGQGPHTPWQMFAVGIIGFLAGILFRKGLLGRTKVSLTVFGGLATFVIYGGIVNPAAVFIWQPNPTPQMFLWAYLQGIPFDLVHAVATVFFMMIIARPMLEKLDRIKVKYGLVE